ncbi:MAG: Muramoyltetrapeptide carboxypeptidase [Myxococcaceae bacterium]|nr:Muramoyltetrapeptide carboxypeptidase [Myxococcaceae bacterium]
MQTFRRPPPLHQDARVHIVAPSSPFDRARFDAGLALIEQRYRAVLAPSLFANNGYLAGADDARLADLRAALSEPEARAIVPPRGGYGATRLLPQLEVESVRTAQKWLVGFSDVTALHALCARAGLCSIHGPMVCSLPDASPALRAAWFALLEGGAPAALTDLTCLQSGKAEGRLFGGNLTVLSALVGTPYLPPLEDVVLILEDVTERPYRLDRMLTSMLQSGFFDGVRAVVLGQFTDCQPGPDGVTALEVVSERLGRLRVPLLADAPVGHVPENWPLLFGAWATVDTNAGRVDFGAPR